LHEPLPHGEKFSGAPLGVLRHPQHCLEMHPGRLAGPAAASLELRIAGQCQRELAPHVLDLGVEAQSLEVVRALLEDRGDLCLGLGQLAELDEHASFLQALLALHRCVNHRLQSGGRGVPLPIEGRGRSFRCQANAGPVGQTPRYRALTSSSRRSSSGRDSWTILPLLMR